MADRTDGTDRPPFEARFARAWATEMKEVAIRTVTVTAPAGKRT